MRPNGSLLLLASLAAAQSTNSSSNSTVSPLYAVPASANSTVAAGLANGTVSVGWAGAQGAGAFSDKLVKLADGDGTSSAVNLTLNDVLYGLLLKFDAATAANQTASPVPFFALISCDNSTSSSFNTTSPSNGTTVSNTSSSIALGDAFALAARLDASIAIVYSEVDESCSLEQDYLDSNASKPLEVWASPSLATTTLLLEQFEHIAQSFTSFNSTLLTSLASNITTSLATGSVSAVEQVGFLVAQLAPQNASSNATLASSGPVVVSIAPAPTSTSKGAVATGSVGQGTTSGAERVGSAWAVWGASLAMGAWSAWVVWG